MSIKTDRKASEKSKKLRDLVEEEEQEELEESEDEELEDDEYEEDEELEYEDEDDEEDEEDDEEDDEEEERKPRKKKKKGFPFGALIFMFVLIGITLGAGYFGLQYYDQYQALHAQYDTAVEQVSAELNAAQEEYFLADPDSPANVDIREELSGVLLADAREKAQKLEEETADIDASIREAESRLGQIEHGEDFDYYKAIYDQYVEGREYIEELLSGD